MRGLRGGAGASVGHGLGELAANPGELPLALRERGATHTAYAKTLQLANTLADLGEEAFDVKLGPVVVMSEASLPA